MPLSWIFLTVFALAGAGYFAGRARALASAGQDSRILHSLPHFYGIASALGALIPSVPVLVLWVIVQPVLLENRASAMIPDSVIAEGTERALILSDVRRMARALDMALATGTITTEDANSLPADPTRIDALLSGAEVVLATEPGPELLLAAIAWSGAAGAGSFWMTAVVLLLAFGGVGLAVRRSHKDRRARNIVERGVLVVLMLAASIAVLTTGGIIFSMLFEAWNFFGQYDAASFFFGTTWAPDFRGDSSLGLLPLLWGTLYISFVALLIAVPVGLFAAIYMSEYASARIRTLAKPLIEMLAGIPTIVYGLFALITVGPLLRDYFASPLGLGESSASVMTAGLVMGIMLIPFVSSLSDDIIKAVPQAMRDGSMGLGATKSETIRQVVVPAALPGIVGAILLAASRAIGETMIVVLGAGAAAAQLNKGIGEMVNPFEAMTTVTVKIVSQLTGDTDFAAPETLVAFALGLTLFVFTLGLNVLALWIVRRYREQYE